MRTGSVSASCSPAISDLSAGCAAAPKAIPTSPAEASSVAPIWRTPGKPSMIIPAVITTMTKPSARLSRAMRVARVRAAMSSLTCPARFCSSCESVPSSEKITQPTSAGTAKRAIAAHSRPSSGSASPAMAIISATSAQRTDW